MDNLFQRIIHKLPFKSEAFYVYLILTLMIGFAFVQGIRITKDAEWPYEDDLYRNIGHAQTIVDSDYFADDLYLGEKQWYNPLLPTIVAGVSWITKIPVYIVYTRIGAYLNLLAPLFFFIMLVSFLDKWSALACTFGFLFVTANGLLPQLAATYSYYFHPIFFIQAIFYLALWAYHKAIQTGEFKRYIFVGFLLGLTFMGHTAPAILLGLIIGIMTLQNTIRSFKMKNSIRKIVQPLGLFSVLLLTAFVVSTPYHYTILGHYHLKIINPAPCNMVFEPFQLSNIGSFISQLLSRRLLMMFVGIGFFGLILKRSKRTEKNILLLWLAVSTALIIYNHIWQILQQRNIHLPRIVPTYHFVFYFFGMLSVLYGYGMILLCRFIGKLTDYLKPSILKYRFVRPFLRLPVEKGALVLLLAATAVKVYPSYMARENLIGYRLRAYENEAVQKAYFWIREHTQPEDVFLAPDNLAQVLIGPSGRKVVAVMDVFSNPYVDWINRSSDRAAMFEHLKSGHFEQFHDLAAKYRITHVISYDQTKEISDVSPPFLIKKFEMDQLSIYQYQRKP